VNDGLVSVVLAVIAAAGSIGTAYVAVLARQTKAEVNGRMSELMDRIAVLEGLLVTARRAATRPYPSEDFV